MLLLYIEKLTLINNDVTMSNIKKIVCFILLLVISCRSYKMSIQNQSYKNSATHFLIFCYAFLSRIVQFADNCCNNTVYNNNNKSIYTCIRFLRTEKLDCYNVEY